MCSIVACSEIYTDYDISLNANYTVCVCRCLCEGSEQTWHLLDHRHTHLLSYLIKHTIVYPQTNYECVCARSCRRNSKTRTDFLHMLADVDDDNVFTETRTLRPCFKNNRAHTHTHNLTICACRNSHAVTGNILCHPCKTRVRLRFLRMSSRHTYTRFRSLASSWMPHTMCK